MAPSRPTVTLDRRVNTFSESKHTHSPEKHTYPVCMFYLCLYVCICVREYDIAEWRPPNQLSLGVDTFSESKHKGIHPHSPKKKKKKKKVNTPNHPRNTRTLFVLFNGLFLFLYVHETVLQVLRSERRKTYQALNESMQAR